MEKIMPPINFTPLASLTFISKISIAIIVIVILVSLIDSLLRRFRFKAAERFIDQYQFPARLKSKVLAKHPKLSDAQYILILDGLREYFQVCRIAEKNAIDMPSVIIDEAWHEFILSTRDYGRFCSRAFGRYLHHVPNDLIASEAASKKPGGANKNSKSNANASLRRTWRHACERQAINPSNPESIPLIFSIDNDLNVYGGHIYHLGNSSTGFSIKDMGLSSSLSSNGDSSSSHGGHSSHGGSSDSSSHSGHSSHSASSCSSSSHSGHSCSSSSCSSSGSSCSSCSSS